MFQFWIGSCYLLPRLLFRSCCSSCSPGRLYEKLLLPVCRPAATKAVIQKLLLFLLTGSFIWEKLLISAAAVTCLPTSCYQGCYSGAVALPAGRVVYMREAVNFSSCCYLSADQLSRAQPLDKLWQLRVARLVRQPTETDEQLIIGNNKYNRLIDIER